MSPFLVRQFVFLAPVRQLDETFNCLWGGVSLSSIFFQQSRIGLLETCLRMDPAISNLHETRLPPFGIGRSLGMNRGLKPVTATERDCRRGRFSFQGAFQVLVDGFRTARCRRVGLKQREQA